MNFSVSKWYLLLLICTGFASAQVLGQSPLSSEAYQKMVQKLLRHSVKEITPDQLSDTTNYLFLDARAKPEYDISHLKNARWIGYDSLQQKVLNTDPKGSSDTGLLLCRIS